MIFITKIFIAVTVFCELLSVNGSPRIHGGTDAPAGYAPHMVALLVGARPRVVCGGSIVTSTHVLTAAHCITHFIENHVLDTTFHGRVGSNIWHSGGLRVDFLQHFIHPNWDEDIIKYDVGILLLSDSLVFNELVGKIALNFEWVDGGEEMYVTGWGSTEWKIIGDIVHLAPTPDELQLLYVETLTPQQCAEGINSSEQWAAVAPPLDPRLEICTLHSVGHGMCNGDSGSALVSLTSGAQCGMVSWGMPCARGAPDFYTRLYGVRHFILSILHAS